MQKIGVNATRTEHGYTTTKAHTNPEALKTNYGSYKVLNKAHMDVLPSKTPSKTKSWVSRLITLFVFLAVVASAAVVFTMLLSVAWMVALATIGVGLMTLIAGAVIKKINNKRFAKVNSDGAHQIMSDLNLKNTQDKEQSQYNDQQYRFLYDALKNSDLPKSLIKELKQTARWAHEVTIAKRWWTEHDGHRRKKPENKVSYRRINNVAKDIVNTVDNLAPSRSCLVPSGIYLGGEFHHLLLHITKNEDHTLKIKIVTRDQTINNAAQFTVNGKELGLTDIIFNKVPAEKINNAEWFATLLMMQTYDKMATIDTFKRLFSDIDEHMEHNTEGRYRKKVDQGRLESNVLAFITDHYFTDGEQIARGRVQKMSVELASLWLVYRRWSPRMGKAYELRKEIEQSLTRCRKQLVQLHQERLIDNDEHTLIERELLVIQKALQKAEDYYRHGKGRLPMAMSKKNNREYRYRSSVQPTKMSKLQPQGHELAPNNSQDASITDYAFDQQQKFQKPAPAVLDTQPFDNIETIAEFLEEKIAEFAELIQNRELVKLQALALPIVLELPFEPHTRNQEDYYDYDTWNNSLHVEEVGHRMHLRTKVAMLLTTLSNQITTAAQLSLTILPDRVTAVYKLMFIVDHLAHLNNQESGMTDQVQTKMSGYFSQPFQDNFGQAKFYSGSYLVFKADKRDLYHYEDTRNNNLMTQFSDYQEFRNHLIETDLDHSSLEFNENRREKNKLKRVVRSSGWLHCLQLVHDNAQKLQIAMTFGRPFLHQDIRDVALQSELAETQPRQARLWDGYGGYGGYDLDDYLGAYGRRRNRVRSAKPGSNTEEYIMDRSKRYFRSEDLPAVIKDNRDIKAELLLAFDPTNVYAAVFDFMHNRTNLLELPDVRHGFLLNLLFEPHFEQYFIADQHIARQKLGQLPRLLHELFTLHFDQNNVKLALFIAQVSVGLRRLLAKHEQSVTQQSPHYQDYQTALEHLPDFSKELGIWLEESLKNDNVMSRYRFSLLTYHVKLLQDKAEFNEQELMDMVYYNTLLNMSMIDPDEFYLQEQDHVKRSFADWGDHIKQLLTNKPDLRQHLCERICAFQGVPIKKEATWEGDFPRFTYNGYEPGKFEYDIELTSGTFSHKGILMRRLPIEVVRHPHYRKLFGDAQIGVAQIKHAAVKNLEVNCFEYPEGVHNRLELKNRSILTVFRKTQGTPWLQYTDNSSLTAASDMFGMTRELPGFLLGEHLFFDPNRRQEFYTFNAQGNVEFKLTFGKRSPVISQLVLSRIDDLRKNSPHRGMHAVLGSDANNAFLYALAEFEQPEQMLLWHKRGFLVELEMPRYGVRFQVRRGQLYIIDDDLAGYRVDLSRNIDKAKDVSASILLVNDQPQTPDYLVLAQSTNIEWQDVKDKPFRFQKFADWTKRVVRTGIMHRPIAADFEELAHVARNVSNRSDLKYFVFQIEGELGNRYSCVKGHPVPGIFHLLILCIKSTVNPFSRAHEQIVNHLSMIDRMGEAFLQMADSDERSALLAYFEKLAQIAIDSDNIRGFAMGLKVLYYIYHRLDQSMQSKIIPLFEALYAQYVTHKKRMDAQLRLTDQEQAFMLQHTTAGSITEYSRQTFEVDLDFQQWEQEQPGRAIQRLIDPDQNIDAQKNFREMIHNTMGTRGIFPLPFRFLRLDALGILMFRSMYETIRKAHVNSSEFREVWMTLLAQVPLFQTGNVSTASSTGQVHALIIRSLFTIAHAKRQNQLLTLPEFENFPWAQEVRYMRNRREHRKALARHRITKRAADKKLRDVLRGLDEAALPNDVFDPNYNAPQATPPNVVVIDQDVVQPPVVVQDAETSKQIANNDAIRSAIHVQDNTAPALFKLDEALAFFGEQTKLSAQELAINIDLSPSEQHSEACVRSHAKDELAEIQLGKDALVNKEFRLINRQKFPALKKLIRAKSKAHQDKMDAAYAKIHTLISVPETKALYKRLNARYRTRIEFDELLQLYMRRDLDSIREKLAQIDVNGDQVIAEFDHYFMSSLYRNWAEYLYDRCEKIERSAMLDDTKEGNKLFQELTQVVANKEPELVVIQSKLGLIARAGQYSIVGKLTHDINLLLQAPTGSGKTTMIMTLLARVRPDGDNLVVLKFLNPLIPAALKQLRTVLGDTLGQNITPILYNPDDPTVEERLLDGDIRSVSRFRTTLEIMQKITRTRGVVVSDHRTGSMFENKLLAMLDQFYSDYYSLPQIPMAELAYEHVFHLASIFDYRQKHEESIVDEWDSFFDPTKEDHLRVKDGEKVQEYMTDTLWDIFCILNSDERLGLSNNIQADLEPALRSQVISDSIKIYIDALLPKLKSVGIPLNAAELSVYFTGQDDTVIDQYLDAKTKKALVPAGITGEQGQQFLTALSALTFAKDIFTIYLEDVLSKKYSKDFILNADGSQAIPVEVPGKAAKSNEFDDFRERMCFTSMSYLHVGLNFDTFVKWCQSGVELARGCMISEAKHTLADTSVGERFSRVFKGKLLDKYQNMSEREQRELYDFIHHPDNLEQLAYFVKLFTGNLTISTARVSSDAQNQASQSKAVCGVSATSSVVGHRKFSKQSELSGKGVHGEMFIRYARNRKKLVQYDPAQPEKIVEDLAEKVGENVIYGVIDGPAALSDVAIAKVLEDLIAVNPKINAVQYFDLEGHYHLYAKPGTKKKDVTMSTTATYFIASQTRGADVMMPTGYVVLLDDGNAQTSDTLQFYGRCRKDNPLFVAVSKYAGITTFKDKDNAELANTARRRADYLYRNKTQELRDILLLAMKKKIANTILDQGHPDDPKWQNVNDRAKLAPVLDLVHELTEHNVLVTRNPHLYTEPGDYFETHHKIVMKDADPVVELSKLKDSYIELAKTHKLQDALDEFTEIPNYELIRHRLLPLVYPGSSKVGQTVEIQTNVNTTVQLNINQEFSGLISADAHTYLDQYQPYKVSAQAQGLFYSLTSHYDGYPTNLGFCFNYAPNGRGINRKPYDHQQSRMQYIGIKPQGSGQGNVFIALSKKDVQSDSFQNSVHFNVVYDLRDRTAYSPSGGQVDHAMLSSDEFYQATAVLRFEDGQIDEAQMKGGTLNGFSPEESTAFKDWLLSLDEKFTPEEHLLAKVLRNREDLRKRYRDSHVHRLFRDVDVTRLEQAQAQAQQQGQQQQAQPPVVVI